MRIAVLADIHANFPALMAVLEDAAGQDIDLDNRAIWCLGDVVGYGPHPVEAVNFLKEYVEPDHWVLGNHDAMLADILFEEDLASVEDPAGLLQAKTIDGMAVTARGDYLDYDTLAKTNSDPIVGLSLNRKTLAADVDADVFWRGSFCLERRGPQALKQDGVNYLLVHGSQINSKGENAYTRYIYAWDQVFLLPNQFRGLQERFPESPRVQWIGHTHVPTLVRGKKAQSGEAFEFLPERILPQTSYPLDTDFAVVNPGSVGQPRDLDQRAAYAILDTLERTVTFRRVAYDWRQTARDLTAGGYPDGFISRLKTAAADEKVTPDEWIQYYQEAARK